MFVLVSLLSFIFGCGEVRNHRAVTAELKIGPAAKVQLKEGELNGGYDLILRPEGPQWLFVLAAKKVAGPVAQVKLRCFRHSDDSWIELAPAYRDQGELYVDFAAVSGADGNPVLIRWSSTLPPVPLQAVRWDGNNWKPMEPPGKPAWTSGSMPIVVAGAPAGAIHAVFLSRLEPEESYVAGMDGYFPLKPFYVAAEGSHWSEAEPIADRSRWSYGSMALMEGRDRFHLICQREFKGRWIGHEQEFEYRSFTDVGWSDPERISAKGDMVKGLSIAEDDRGNLHVVFSTIKGSWYMERRDGRWLKATAVGRGGRDAVIISNPQGQVLLYWREVHANEEEQGFLQTWNSRGTSEAVEVPALRRVRLFSGGDGRFYMAWASDGRDIAIAEVITGEK